MIKLDINELPRWSPWPSRIMGTCPWETPHRTVEKVSAEYDRDKYARCLAYLERAHSQACTAEDIKRFELGDDMSKRICISVGEELFLAEFAEARRQFYEVLRSSLSTAIEGAGTVVELGCGYGFNLWHLSQHFHRQVFVGGEYSPNAVELANRLYAHNGRVQVCGFDFYDSAYRLLDPLDGPVLVFTSHAIEQLPTAAAVLKALVHHRRKIAGVVHFEPVFEVNDDSLLGQLRRRYIEMNDYNRDLLTLLRRDSAIEVEEVRSDVIGLNPLNATTIVRWGFRD